MEPQPMGKVRDLSRLAGRVAARSTRRWSSLWKFLGICLLAAVVGGSAAGLPHAQGAAAVAGMPLPAQGSALLPQTITFDPPRAAAVGQPVRLSASTDADANENLVVSFRSNTPDVCTVSGNTVTPTTANVCTITASQGGNDRYAAARPMRRSFQAHTGTTQQTISFDQPRDALPGQSVTLSASTNAKERLDVSFRSESPIVCTVSGSTVTTVAVGRCDITAYQGGSATYAAAQGSGSFQATTPEVRSAQQIVFGPVPGTTVGVPVVLTASSRSLAYQRADSATGLAVSYTSQNRRVCTVSGATLTLTAAGTCTVTASQPGDAQYAPADSMTGSFPVGKIPQTISFSLPGSATVGRPVILTATASSGLAVNYTSGSTDVCTVSGSTLTLAKAGTCTVTASQPGDDKYLPARPETRSFPVQKIPQTIDFRPPQDVAFGRPVRLIATASSGLPVSYSTDTPDVCRVSGRTVTTRAAGACAVTASQVGDDRYAPARDAARSFRVERAAQIITFTPPDGMTLGQPVTLSASASSGLDVSYHADTPAVCTVSGSSVSPATVGTCAITASQPGNDDYAPAAGESRSFPVHPASGDRVRKNSQAIAFAQPSPAAVAQMVPLSASATSGLAVSFRSDTPSVCTVSGNTVTAITAGTCAVTASQTGDDHFAAARDMQRSFAVHVGQAPGNKGRGKASQTIFFGQPQAAAVGQVVPLTASASSGLAVSFQSDTPAVCSVSGATVTTTTAGTCTVTGSQAGSPGASITRIKEGKS